ncbi:murein hydrolase activator EnvC family protein [Vitreoscilla stercoraria]|uniref:Peptidoglycan DD-metalloendopeptidase family protein n=1 Tax=Vitreoscilla stercoraria TaxID=61 RepID=A0ABY4EE38_VITST|nr:peptidoglycan DD-metalloendopeptidase family protein [Vitreoscilla stercoraria]UOO93546.1 peptidoglycan DD-metalloendopeptidase family protein [Vitreoscilla stercoraria]
MKWIPLFGSVFALSASMALWANTAAPSAQNLEASQDVQAVQQELKQAEQTLSEHKQEQKKLNTDIQKTQTALQAASHELAQLTLKQRQSAEVLSQLQLQLSQLQTQNQHNKAQAQRLLNSQYKNKQPEAVVLLLKNSNPNQKGRHIAYLRYLHQANEQVLRDLKQHMVQIDAQQTKIAAEHAKLQQLQQQSTKVHQRLQSQRQGQAKQHTVLQNNIAKQQAHIQDLKQDEKRLQTLLARLNRQQAAKPKVIKKTLPKVVSNQAVTTKPKTLPKLNTPNTQHGLTAEDMALDANAFIQTAASAPSHRFSQMQGRMALPATGMITGRFGSARPSGGTWKGIFIQNQGASVHTVAEGEVVYAATLQGYGSTVIVDHDGGYMTVYSGLASIQVSTGEQLTSRARIGSSGRLPSGEQGTYFEVRYQTRAMNPLSWVG